VTKPATYELEPLNRRDVRMFGMIWRRQGRKTTNLSRLGLYEMAKKPGRLVIFASASLNVGGEVTYRAAEQMRTFLEQHKHREMEANVKFNDEAAFREVFEQGRLELKLRHKDGKVSRFKVIAPNPATARGFSGTVLMDEIGFIRDFRAVWEAVEPIASSDPTMRMILATTPPADDAHLSHEMLSPGPGVEFAADPAGHWYRSETGLLVHRVDVHDGYAAGVVLYHPETGEVITAAEHRAMAMDKDAWDRNYGLKFAMGGTAACSFVSLHHAQERGRAAGCLAAQDDFPFGWPESAALGNGIFHVGVDLATTENEKSNPSAIAVVEQIGADHFVRMLLRWKTSDPRLSRAIIAKALELPGGRRVRSLALDASNERFFAADVKRDFGSKTAVRLFIAGEKAAYKSEEMSNKQFAGSLLVNALDDARVILPPDRWVRDDFRLVRKEKGTFQNQLDQAGNHGDTFDAVKLALWAAHNGGPAAIEAVKTDNRRMTGRRAGV
jgi:hypothetical protein